MNQSLLISLLGVILFCGCDNRNLITTTYEGGQIFEKYNINPDSTRQGIYVKFRENGDTLEKAFYNNGLLNGRRMLYFDSNKVEIMENYVNDVLNGKYIVYHKNQYISMEADYVDNSIDGIIRRYFPSGTLLEEVTFADSQEEGPFVEYYESGGKKWEGTYTNGNNEIGPLIQYAENGDTIKKMECDERYICHTIWQNPKYISE